MRAHMGLKQAGLKVELREVSLKSFPVEMLQLSDANTVPVLVLPDGIVFSESWDILKWALEENDPDNWLGNNHAFLAAAERLVESNDFTFKVNLDHYKYADRFPEHSQHYYRAQCEEFIRQLESALATNNFLLTDRVTVADIAVFPFVRQFSMVEREWFAGSPYVQVRHWLARLMDTELFRSVFSKHDTWQQGDPPVFIGITQYQDITNS
jgi:glutathione S-transferase